MTLDPETLRTHRQSIGATLRELAARSDITPAAISAFEGGYRPISAAARERVRLALVGIASDRRTAVARVLRRFGRTRRNRG